MAKRRALTVSFAAADNRLTPTQFKSLDSAYLMTRESHRRAGGASQLATPFALLTLVAVLASGCGTGTYNDQYTNRLKELQQTSKFSVLTSVPTDDLPVNFRVPKVFTSSYDLKSEDPHDRGKHVARQIIMPPFLYSPIGFKRTYEGKNADKKPFYLSVWMYDAEHPKDASGGEDAIRNSLRSILNDPNAKWEDVEADTPDGQTRKWRHLLLKGDQEFEIERSGNLENDREAGVFDLWVYKTPGWDVMLGWRCSGRCLGQLQRRRREAQGPASARRRHNRSPNHGQAERKRSCRRVRDVVHSQLCFRRIERIERAERFERLK